MAIIGYFKLKIVYLPMCMMGVTTFNLSRLLSPSLLACITVSLPLSRLVG